MEYSSLIIGYAGYVFATVGTPGPNNIMVASSGANYGLKRSIPHIMGINQGFIFMLLVMGFGLGSIFTTYPIIHTILQYLSIGFLLYLAFKIATSKRSNNLGGSEGKPFGFMQAAAFQWVNPKAWAMNVTAVTLYVSLDGVERYYELFYMVLINMVVGLPLVICWCLFGREIGKLLKSEKAFMIFNYGMAGLLVVTVFMLFI